MYSGFEGFSGGEGLASWLRARGVTAVDVVGIATDHCVRASALDAVHAGLDVFVFEDLVVGVDPGRSAAALDEIRTAGGHTGPSDIDQGLRSPRGVTL